MFKIARTRLLCLAGLTPFNVYDAPDKGHTAKAFYEQANEGETGWDRLHSMFSVDEFGTRSPEMSFVTQGFFFGSFAGIMLGGTTKARIAYENFIDTNQATKFTHTFEAKKKLQTAVTSGFAKGAFQWGWRLGAFTGSYILLTTSIAAYRGKSSILEYTTAGFLVGSCYKLSLGPRAMLTAGVVGGALSTVAGIVALGVLNLSGTTMEEVRYWQYNWKKDRDRYVHNIIKTSRNPETQIEQTHNEMIKNNESLEQETKEQSKVA